MRTIKKTIKVHQVEVVIYDRKTKEERTETYMVSEGTERPPIPEGCVRIEQKAIPGTEKEVVYTMSPETFMKHATISE